MSRSAMPSWMRDEEKLGRFFACPSETVFEYHGLEVGHYRAVRHSTVKGDRFTVSHRGCLIGSGDDRHGFRSLPEAEAFVRERMLQEATQRAAELQERLRNAESDVAGLRLGLDRFRKVPNEEASDGQADAE